MTKKQEVVLNVAEASDIMHQYHSSPMGGHSGINSTLQNISENYTWNGIKSDIVDYSFLGFVGRHLLVVFHEDTI